MVDSDLRSITPEWIDLLISPVARESYDFVTPYYLRHKYDGTITNSIIYPLTRALYGKNIRQPIGGDFGFSGELAGFFLSKEIWDSDIARYGIDIWMTTTAVASNFKVCQSFLGAKIHDPKDPASDLSSMLTQVVGSAFNLMETYERVWKKTGRIKEIKIFGFPHEVGLEPVNVNIEAMYGKFLLGVNELIPLWSLILSQDITDFLSESKKLPLQAFDFPDETWVRIIYLFAAAYHKKTMNRDNLLKSLTPLYLGKIASFVQETLESSSQAVEKRLENLCDEFAKNKPFLVENF
ncbi:MAG: glycosyl transferase family 2 [Deltaproteobacteria bacterium]|nr:glycosyl transferase family 2 [Deltaproteobacteria bacterium]